MTNEHWDTEMHLMKSKLDSLLNDNYIYLCNETKEYILHPKALGKPVGYDKWLKANSENERTNNNYKRVQQNKENLSRRRKRKDAHTYVCEHCGFTSKTWYPAAFNRFHGENCKNNKANV